MSLSMRVGLGQFNELTDEKLLFIKQLGADDFLMNTPKLPGDQQWELDDLVALRARADAAGLRLMALENVPRSFYDKAMLGLPGRDEQIAHMQTTIRNMGKAGIPILGYHWMPSGVWRTPEPATLRGNAKGTRFDMAEHANAPLTHERVFSTEEMWANYEYYMSRILPVAEEAGVKLALHPDDPPVESLAVWRASLPTSTAYAAPWKPLTAHITGWTSAWAAGRRWGAGRACCAPSVILAARTRSFTSTSGMCRATPHALMNVLSTRETWIRWR
jgi:D-mannonate dehydratase